MKIKIKSFNGELPSYLTLEKTYRVGGRNGYNELMIRDDENRRLYIKLTDWRNLNGGEWEVVDET